MTFSLFSNGVPVHRDYSPNSRILTISLLIGFIRMVIFWAVYARGRVGAFHYFSAPIRAGSALIIIIIISFAPRPIFILVRIILLIRKYREVKYRKKRK